MVTLCFDNSLSGIAIDFFGMEVPMAPYDDNHFTVTIHTAVNIQFYGWLFGLGEDVRILEPQSAADGMKEQLDRMSMLYKE